MTDPLNHPSLSELPAQQVAYLARTAPSLVRSLKRGRSKPTILGVLPSFHQKYRARVRACPLCGVIPEKGAVVTFWTDGGTKHLGHTLCRAAQLMHDADKGGRSIWADELERAERDMARNRAAILKGDTYRAQARPARRPATQLAQNRWA